MKKTPRRSKSPGAEKVDAPTTWRLNKYIAHSGVCSRREAADLVKGGQVLVNGVLETNPAREIQAEDVVTCQGKRVKPAAQLVYLLLNKPKNVITTLSDEKGRKTVHDLIRGKVAERVYPVGRLDRNTTGLLLLTNDGQLAQRLSHPSFRVHKLYHVKLDRDLTRRDFESILQGVELEDGIAEVDGLDYAAQKRDEVGIEIHSGKNRVLRRLFEKLGYEVLRLDRVLYAGLTRKGLPRGQFRHLTPQEVIRLKHFRQL